MMMDVEPGNLLEDCRREGRTECCQIRREEGVGLTEIMVGQSEESVGRI